MNTILENQALEVVEKHHHLIKSLGNGRYYIRQLKRHTSLSELYVFVLQKIPFTVRSVENVDITKAVLMKALLRCKMYEGYNERQLMRIMRTGYNKTTTRQRKELQVLSK